MSNLENETIVWIDLETTGLYGANAFTEMGERSHLILEFAMVITDTEMNTLDHYSSVIHHDIDLVTSKMNDYVTNMHTNNGLIHDIGDPGKTASLYAVETRACDIIKEHCTRSTKKPLLAGNSVHFDRFFMSAQMPRMHNMVNYRGLDVSAIAEFYRILSGTWPTYEKGETTHRAMDDILSSINQLKFLLSNIRTRDNTLFEKLSLL